jgi:Asp/Glu/hydantoin racemase
MKRLLIVNPNTNATVTRWLAEEARRVAPVGVEVLALNADSELEALQTPADVLVAGRAVVRAIEAIAHACDIAGAVIAAFGDPGLKEARALGATRVVGLGEASIRSAAQGGRRFSIVTLGAAMRESMVTKVEALGFEPQLARVQVLPFSIPDMIADRDMARALIVDAVNYCPSEVVLLGGAPFAGMTQSISQVTGKIVLCGVEACVRAILTD